MDLAGLGQTDTGQLGQAGQQQGTPGLLLPCLHQPIQSIKDSIPKIRIRGQIKSPNKTRGM